MAINRLKRAASVNGTTIEPKVFTLGPTQRIHQLRELARVTFIECVPAECTAPVRYTYYDDRVQARIRDLGNMGGPEYDRVSSIVKYTWANTPRTYQESLKALGL